MCTIIEKIKNMTDSLFLLSFKVIQIFVIFLFLFLDPIQVSRPTYHCNIEELF